MEHNRAMTTRLAVAAVMRRRGHTNQRALSKNEDHTEHIGDEHRKLER